jgi:enoyl-CoA hydratase/carnithine racemase
MDKQMFPGRDPEEFDFQEILYEKKDSVARVTINRPKFYNAYNTQALRELIAAFTDAADDDSVAVVIYTGAGDKAFSTGGDVKEYQSYYTQKPRDYYKYMGLFRGYLEALLNLGKPSIARINGIAVGGGNESQMACDLAVMVDDTYISQIGTNVGSVACGGATQWLPIMVGDRRAREILLMNQRISAQQALDWGLVNRIAPREKLDEVIDEMVAILIDKFPECTRYTRTQINFWKELSWHSTIGHARDWLTTHFTSAEPNEGMRAFVQKRKVDYRGLRQKMADGGSSEFLWGPYATTCPSCGADGLPAEFGFCGKCGTELKVGETAKA